MGECDSGIECKDENNNTISINKFIHCKYPKDMCRMIRYVWHTRGCG